MAHAISPTPFGGRFSSLTIATVVLGLGAATVQPAAAQTQRYEVSSIGRLPGAFSTVPFAINNAGEVVGWCQGPFATLRAFHYIPGTGITEIVPPPGYTESRALDITNNGIVVGVATNGLSTNAAIWRLQDGVYTILPTLGFNCSEPHVHAVNSSGALVGHTCGDANGNSRPFYFSDATGMIDLSTVGIGSAVDINDAGVVTGGASGGAYRWTPGGTLEILGTLPSPYNDYAIGQSINESGQVTGYSGQTFTGPDGWRTFYYTDGAGMVEIATTHLLRSAGWSINEAGHAVGNIGTGSSPERDAWVWTPERGTEMLTSAFVGDPDFYGYQRAVEINDLGQIVATGTSVDPLESSVAVILTPVAACPADFDGDGVVNVSDFLAFLTSFSAGEVRADFNGDGQINVNDFLAFLTGFGQGCP